MRPGDPPGRPSAWSRRRLLSAFGAVAGAAGIGAWASARAPATATDGLPRPLSSLLAGRAWLNTPPLTPADVRGKVVLVNFWTYSCINSLRPLPYVRAWARKYADRGLVVVGVHTPEFAFEKDPANVARALSDLDAPYPVVLDSDYAIWRAFGNEAWPAFYFLGRDGRVHRRVLGEGGYEASERLLQALLSEGKAARVADPVVELAGRGPQAAPDWKNLESPETYLGYAKATGFRSPGALAHDRPRAYRPADRLARNTWSLEGGWRAGDEFATATEADAAVSYRFHARDLHMVLAPPPGGRSVRFRVTLDGAAPGADHGFDTDAQGWGRLDVPRMYQLVRQARPVDDRTFRIEFAEPGARAYVFTFG